VSVNILDLRGRGVAAVADGIFPAGRHEAVWDAKRVPAGIYFWRVMVDGREAGVGKIVVGK
jgi:hypothetical protein